MGKKKESNTKKKGKKGNEPEKIQLPPENLENVVLVKETSDFQRKHPSQKHAKVKKKKKSGHPAAPAKDDKKKAGKDDGRTPKHGQEKKDGKTPKDNKTPKDAKDPDKKKPDRDGKQKGKKSKKSKKEQPDADGKPAKSKKGKSKKSNKDLNDPLADPGKPKEKRKKDKADKGDGGGGGKKKSKEKKNKDKKDGKKSKRQNADGGGGAGPEQPLDATGAPIDPYFLLPDNTQASKRPEDMAAAQGAAPPGEPQADYGMPKSLLLSMPPKKDGETYVPGQADGGTGQPKQSSLQKQPPSDMLGPAPPKEPKKQKEKKSSRHNPPSDHLGPLPSGDEKPKKGTGSDRKDQNPPSDYLGPTKPGSNKQDEQKGGGKPGKNNLSKRIKKKKKKNADQMPVKQSVDVTMDKDRDKKNKHGVIMDATPLNDDPADAEHLAELRINIDEVLRIGAVMERHNLNDIKRISFTWLAFNRQAAYDDLATFSGHINNALGELEIDRMLALDALNVLYSRRKLSMVEYNTIVEGIYHADGPLTVSRLSFLIRHNSRNYQQINLTRARL